MPMLTVSKWAESQGISKQAGYMAVKRCSIPIIDGEVDAEVATLLYRSRTRPRANNSEPAPAPVSQPASPGVAVESYEMARRRRESAEASMAELKEAELRGELVRRSAIEREMASRLVALRESLEVLADRLAAMVAAEADAAVCRRLLRDEHRNAMAAFASAIAPADEPDEVADGSA